MHSPPRIRRLTRRNTNENSSSNNTVGRRLFDNTQSETNTSGIQNNPHFLSMENTPERVVNQYTPRARERHYQRVKRRGAIRRNEYEKELSRQERLKNTMEKAYYEQLLKKGTPTKSEQRRTRKRLRTPNRNNNNTNTN